MNEHADRDHSEQPTRDERVERYAEAVTKVLADFDTVMNVRLEAWAISHNVLVVADAELAEKDATIAALQGVINEAAERMEKAEAALARVEALHKVTTIPAITNQACLAEECDHEDECPTEPVEACAACWDFANDVDSYYGETSLTRVLWPCDTIKALRGEGA